MALVPSFSAYAPAPQLAEAYLGAERIRQQAAADAARVSLGYAQIAQNRQEAEMRMAAQKEIAAAQAIKQAQEAEVERAYKDTQFGLQERNLRVQEAASQRLLQEAARDFERQQEYGRLQQKFQADAVGQGKSAEEAAQYGARMAQLTLGGIGTAGLMKEKPDGPGITASEKQLRYRELQRQWKAIDDKWPGRLNTGMTPEDSSRMKDLEKQMNELSALPSMTAPPSVSAASPQQWLVDPNTIPVGGTPRPSFFIGTPPQQQMDVSGLGLSLPKSSTNRVPRVLSIRQR